MILSRRRLLAGGAAAALAAPMLARVAAAQEIAPFGEILELIQRNSSAFALHRWQDHFDTLRNGAILSDTKATMLHYWSEDESIVRVFLTSVPASEDLTPLGYTKRAHVLETGLDTAAVPSEPIPFAPSSFSEPSPLRYV